MILDEDIDNLIQEFRCGRARHLAGAAQLQRVQNDLNRQELAIQTTIADIQVMIGDMQRKITELERESRNIKRKTEIVQSLNTPIRKLPPELLSIILELAIDTNVILSRPGSRWAGMAAVSEVCSHWRNVLLETPSIWASLSLYLHHTCVTDVAIQNAWKYLETAISRARGVPLSVTIEFYWFLPENGPWGRQFLPLLKTLVKRPWRSATIRHLGFGEGFASIHNSGLLPHLQSVEVLEFGETTHRKGETIAAGHPLFHDPDSNDYNFPNLRTLLLPHSNLSFSHIPSSLHDQVLHSRLTCLRICVGEDYTETLESLKSCTTSLVSLAFNISPLVHSRRAEERPVTCFRALRELVIEATEGGSTTSSPLDSVNGMLNSIECPRLVSLTLHSRLDYDIHHHSSPRTADLEPFSDFITRSQLAMNLQRFAISGFCVSDAQALEMLQGLPAITELNVGEPWTNQYEDGYTLFTSDFFQRFMLPENRNFYPSSFANVLLPSLKVFRVLAFRNLGKEFRALVENRACRTEIYHLVG
ncbi:hypothetical protein L218DRAFT_1082347 [Marasmius fiardii PR-910]|nr:hypothetical protein L218DRAFT_1082347 [Marasmius fiardii PR-910]